MCSMLPRKTILLRHYRNGLNYFLRSLCDHLDEKQASKKNKVEDTNDILGSISSKYQVFRNEDSSTILDVNEERFKYAQFLETEEEFDIYSGINLNRGITGVYDIEDLVAILKRENAVDVFVVTVPPTYKYVDYICIVSGKSHKHMSALANFVRHIYKKKRNPSDIIPKIEGKDCKNWIALDLGNIALHIFSNEARAKYDLESLWSVGEEYDEECNKPDDPIVSLLEKFTIHQSDTKPLNTNG